MSPVYTHIVTRPFQAEGRELVIGTPVDASSWKNLEKLVSTRYVRVCSEADQQRFRSTRPPSAPVKKVAPVAAARVAAPTPKKKFTIRKKR